MSDEELIARLRYEANTDGYDYHGDLHEKAADRIEALIKEREQWRRAAETRAEGWKISDDARIEAEIKLATCEKYRDAYAECDRIGTQALRDLEAKLAKVVELALEECPFRRGTPKYNDWWHHRRSTLAAFEKENGK